MYSILRPRYSLGRIGTWYSKRTRNIKTLNRALVSHLSEPFWCIASEKDLMTIFLNSTSYTNTAHWDVVRRRDLWSFYISNSLAILRSSVPENFQARHYILTRLTKMWLLSASGYHFTYRNRSPYHVPVRPREINFESCTQNLILQALLFSTNCECSELSEANAVPKGQRHC